MLVQSVVIYSVKGLHKQDLYIIPLSLSTSFILKKLTAVCAEAFEYLNM